MDAFDLDELTNLQAAQESGMMDSCVILKYVDGVLDAYGMQAPNFIEGPVSICGLDPNPKREWGVPSGAGEKTQVEAGEARLRLPIMTQISNLDRVRITHRFGVQLDDAIVYELVSLPRRGPSGLLVDLKRVTNNG